MLGRGIEVEFQPTPYCVEEEAGTGNSDQCIADHVHSIYVSTLHHGGLVGFALLVLVLLLAASDVVELPHGEARTVALVVLAYGMTVLLFDGQTIIRKVDFIWLLYWLPLALVGGLHSRARRQD